MQQSWKPLVEKQLVVENTSCSSFILYPFKQTVLKHSYRSETNTIVFEKLWQPLSYDDSDDLVTSARSELQTN